jgi:CheY-like chemotaxis protein/anti-sigma regulatory factor (Ser/Thr protein kinase)
LLLQIPEQSENFYINSDPEICKKIITHFLDNAVKFTENGTITFGYKHSDHELEFFVKDTGIGIGSESFASIFDKFVKEGSNLYKSTEGSGLGLSIARGMSDAIGGRINLESKPGSGSSFFLLLPVKDNIEVRDNSTETVTALSAGSPILVAEDDETNFYYLNALLNRETKTKILHALNGREAIDIFKANRDIKLILMDMKMPEIDGFEATKQIKQIDKDVHIIAITAYAMSGDEERILAAGCDGYLSKPINKKNLLDKIAEYTKI